MQRKHLVMLPGENLVARLDNQSLALVVELPCGSVRGSSGFLQDRVCGDHLSRDQVLADAEVL
jgi:hypothetical protein